MLHTLLMLDTFLSSICQIWSFLSTQHNMPSWSGPRTGQKINEKKAKVQNNIRKTFKNPGELAIKIHFIKAKRGHYFWKQRTQKRDDFKTTDELKYQTVFL